MESTASVHDPLRGRTIFGNAEGASGMPRGATAMPRGAAAMDEQHFQSLYDATARPIHAYLLGVTGNKDVADDVLQDTYFRFLSRHPAGMPADQSRPYLFRIATNLLRDRWRTRHEEQWPEDFDRGHADDVDTQLDVRQVMQALKPREREMLWLAYVEGMNHREIAVAMGLAALSIRPLLFRARRKAASLLLPEGKTS
jgi:RNA polymerase sigma-70 factor (ECF subfamily)